MALPKPNCSFTLPSLYDDLELDCRLYYPRRSDSNKHFGRTYAIVAHPYAPLGGSFNDPVVGLAGATLLRNGIALTTFNFRGASNSAGRTSWSGKPELGDYVTVYAFMLSYINLVQASLSTNDDNIDHSIPVLILGGYSYGSMIASHLPPLETIRNLVGTSVDESSENEIKHRAEQLSRDMVGFLEIHGRGRSGLQATDSLSPKRGVMMGGYESQSASRRISRESSRKSLDADKVRNSIDRVRQKLKSRRTSQQEVEIVLDPEADPSSLILPTIAYLLISPILPPVAGFTTMFSKLRFERKQHTSSGNLAHVSGGVVDEMLAHPGCCIYGSKDVFTSVKKIQKWAYDIQNRSQGRWTIREVENATHFWQEGNISRQLCSNLEGWLKLLEAQEGIV